MHGGRGHHRAEADHRTHGKIDSAGEHDDGFRRRDHRRREPALDELGHRPDGQNAGKQDCVDHREHGEDEEQRAEAFVAPPLDRPIEARALTQHQTASPCSVGAFRTPMAAATIASSDASACGRRGGHSALVEHHDPIAKMDQFGRVGAEQDDGFALRRHCAQRKVDLALGLDVDAARRIIQKQDRRLERQPFRQRDLLLVAAGQRLGRPPPVASNIEALRQTFGDCVLLRSPATLGAATGEQWQEQIEVDRVRQKQAFLASIRRNVGDADSVGVGDLCEGNAAHGGSVGEHAELVRPRREWRRKGPS